jgi:hypothetical protein
MDKIRAFLRACRDTATFHMKLVAVEGPRGLWKAGGLVSSAIGLGIIACLLFGIIGGKLYATLTSNETPPGWVTLVRWVVGVLAGGFILWRNFERFRDVDAMRTKAEEANGRLVDDLLSSEERIKEELRAMLAAIDAFGVTSDGRPARDVFRVLFVNVRNHQHFTVAHAEPQIPWTAALARPTWDYLKGLERIGAVRVVFPHPRPIQQSDFQNVSDAHRYYWELTDPGRRAGEAVQAAWVAHIRSRLDYLSTRSVMLAGKAMPALDAAWLFHTSAVFTTSKPDRLIANAGESISESEIRGAAPTLERAHVIQVREMGGDFIVLPHPVYGDGIFHEINNARAAAAQRNFLEPFKPRPIPPEAAMPPSPPSASPAEWDQT